VEDVAHDDDPLPGKVAERGPERVRVEETLRRMRVPAVAGVDDRRVGAFGDEIRRARRRMAHDDEIAAQRLQRAHGVPERLALLH
jgi:hypothetical protein